MGAWINFNGTFLPAESPVVGAGNRGLRYGDGIFETIKWVEGRILLGEYHFERLFRGCGLLQIGLSKHMSARYFAEQISGIVKKNGMERCARIRLMIFRGNGGIYELEERPNFLIECLELSQQKYVLNENGLHVGVFTGATKSCDGLSNLKSNNCLVYVMAALHAKMEKWNDALVMNTNLRICESTISNLFWIKNNTLYTPPLAEGCVAGVMRSHLLRFLPRAGFTVNEKPAIVNELEEADEIFLTNAMGIRWVSRLNNGLYQNNVTRQVLHSTNLQEPC